MKKQILEEHILPWMAISLFSALFFFSCNPVKQVLKDDAKLEKVGREWEKKNPCVNDTIIKTKSDTTIVLDTLYNIITDTIREAGKEIIIIKKEPVRVEKTLHIHDTVTNTVVDNRILGIALDSVNYFKGKAQYYKSQFDEQKKATAQAEKEKRRWKFKFWMLFIIPVVLIVGYKLLKARFTLPF